LSSNNVIMGPFFFPTIMPFFMIISLHSQCGNHCINFQITWTPSWKDTNTMQFWCHGSHMMQFAPIMWCTSVESWRWWCIFLMFFDLRIIHHGLCAQPCVPLWNITYYSSCCMWLHYLVGWRQSSQLWKPLFQMGSTNKHRGIHAFSCHFIAHYSLFKDTPLTQNKLQFKQVVFKCTCKTTCSLMYKLWDLSTQCVNSVKVHSKYVLTIYSF
jgi:hypothetical protein